MAKLTNPESLAADVQQAFETLRSDHELRSVTDEESGTGIDRLATGVYGFTYSPAVENFPLFKERDLRCYEGHKLADGSVFLLGFLTAAEKQTADDASATGKIHLFAEPKDDATELVRIPMTRVKRSVEHSQRGNNGLEIELG
jgi:hypothetical protein